MFKPFRRVSALQALALTALVLLVILTGCQPKGPKIEITPAEIDMGKMPQKHMETTYTIKNAGSEPLKISKVTTSCDCTKASVENSEVAPGATTVMHVTMDPALLNLYGNIRRDIVVESNDPKNPVAKAIFKVEIQKP